MHDILVQWWAQQLTLCGWPAVDDPRYAVTPASASERLATLGIVDRDEFVWRLWESAADLQQPAASRLAALELLALGNRVGWSDSDTDRLWLAALAQDIRLHWTTLDAWLEALRELGDPGLDAAGHQWLRFQRQGQGVSWSVEPQQRLQTTSAGEPQPGELWRSDVWRARAAFAPVLTWPFVPGEQECHQQRRWFVDEAGISDRDALVASLDWLARQGHRHGWELDALKASQCDDATNREWSESLGDQQGYANVVLRYVEEKETLEWAAWDWLRLIDQAWLGFVAGWISSDEAERYAAHGVDLLQQRYTDWESIARAYQRGRGLFEGSDLRGEFDAEWDELLSVASSPWQLPLAECLTDSLRQTSRQAVRARYASPGAWVLAIAAVRDPDLVYRRELHEAPDSSRREDAERYLDEALLLRRDEGVAGLARSWMPAQVHHLNQLAVDAKQGVAGRKNTAMQRQLAGCADHAATIFMAEKYAFHLLMASDSGRYASDDIQARANDLSGVLSRFYRDPERLLSAWSTWEALLAAEGEEESLVDEIEWHRGDPGSRWHWLTPVFEGDWQEPGERPTLAQFTAISLAGPLNEGAWQAPQKLGAQERAELQESLEHQYAFQERAGLVDFLDFLIEAGDRQEYQINYAPYTLNRRWLDEEIAVLETGECSEEERVHRERLRHVRHNACRCNDTDLTAWDIAQLVDLTLAGRQLGWLDDAQWEHYLQMALDLAQSHYSSWKTYADGLYSGFGFFMDVTPERETFLTQFRQALDAWLTATPLLAGSWASLDFPGRPGRHVTPWHVDVLPGDPQRLH